METPFGKEHGAGHGESVTCDVCEGMCLDAVDGTLSAAEQAAFERHIAGCLPCAEQFAEAQRGAAWMDMLKAHRPEPSAALLTSILAKTSGAGIEAAGGRGTAPVATPLPFPAMQLPAMQLPDMQLPAMQLSAIAAMPPAAGGRGAGRLLLFGRKLAASASFSGGTGYLQPRLIMTAAMAFFSLALTMNLTGTRLSDLRPGALHRTVADAGANAVRTFQGMRVVYQVESKVSELRQGDGGDDAGPFGQRRTADEAQPSTSAHPARDPDPAPVPVPVPDSQPPAPTTMPRGSSELQLPAPPEPRRGHGRLQTEVAWDGLRPANDLRTTPRKGA